MIFKLFTIIFLIIIFLIISFFYLFFDFIKIKIKLNLLVSIIIITEKKILIKIFKKFKKEMEILLKIKKLEEIDYHRIRFKIVKIKIFF